MIAPVDEGLLIPAYNEARTIGRVVEEGRRYVKTVVVVNDGGTDGTGHIAQHAGAFVLTNAKQRGLGASLRRGLAYLLRRGAAIIVTLDGDGVHIPAEIPSLLRAHSAMRADLTIGSRFSSARGVRSVPTPKLAANRLATLLINRVLDTSLTDVASGMRVLGRRAAALKFRSTDFAISFEFLAMAAAANLVVIEYPISVRYDAEELYCTSQYELLSMLRFASNASKGVEVRRTITRMELGVQRYEFLRVRIGKSSLLLHPVKEHKGYCIQQQNPWYLNGEERDPWLVID